MLFGYFCFGQNDSIDLTWKISSKEILVYKYENQYFDSTTIKNPIPNFNKLLSLFSDTIRVNNDSIENQILKLNKSIELLKGKIGEVFILESQKNQDISVKMISYKLNANEELDKEGFFMASALDGVKMRGYINSKGKVISFYSNLNEKNILSLFFELPDSKVLVGDKFNVSVSPFTLNNNYVVDNYKLINEVLIKKVYYVNGDRIAELSYNISGIAEGVSDIDKNSFLMNVNYNCISNFNISKGYLENFKAIMKVKSYGNYFLNQTHVQKLQRINQIPEQAKKYAN